MQAATAESPTRSLSREASTSTDIVTPVDSASAGGTGTLVETPVYPHATTFESEQMSITISSPHLEFTFPNNDTQIVKLPVFSAKDSIGGTISVNPMSYPVSMTAKLVVSLEGAMYWVDHSAVDPNSKKVRTTGPSGSHSFERKHVFFYSSLNLPMNDEAGFDASTLKQNALAAIRRRMSYGKADAKGRKKQSVVEETTPTDTPPSSWVTKTFLFHLPLQSETALPPSVDLRAEALEHERSKTKLVEDVRIRYKLVARYESGLLSLWNHLEVPIIFEPGSDPESFYAIPQPPMKWRETSLELLQGPETTPFKAMLTLPNPPIFARDSESFFFVAFSTTPSDKALASSIAANAKITLNITCTYRIDPNQAAAHTSLGSSSPGTKETIWKWNEPPQSPLTRRKSSRRASSSTTGGRRGSNELTKTKSRDKPLPIVPPPTAEDGETTVTLLSTTRSGFPHRPKMKPDQTNLPDGIWKGQLNYQWWMIPTLDWAGLSVKYHMEVLVEIDGTILSAKKEFRIVEPHTVRKEVKEPVTKRVELDGFI